jgi:type IV secretion system protein VirD4
MYRDDETKLNRIDQAKIDLFNDFKKNKILFICVAILLFAVAVIIDSWMTQYIYVLFRKQSHIAIIPLFTAWTRNPVSIIGLAIIYIALLRMVYRVKLLTTKDYIQNYEENYKMAKSGEYGDAHWQTEEERRECFSREKDYWDIKGEILGKDNKGYLYSLRDDLVGINQNKIVFGSAGSGKSAAIIINDIMQGIRQGDSMIITDSKGDVYRDTSKIARKHNYIVRVLNLKAKEIKNSDAWEPLKYVTAEDTVQAEVLAKAIIENTENDSGKTGYMDYWAKNELNCLKATILLVATTELYEGRRSFQEVVNIITDPQTFNAKFASLPKENPAKNAFDIFAECKDDVQKQILNGMAIRLALLSDRYVKEIVSHDEIDLILPMKRKCIYYIIISDTDNTMKFVASMFFTQLFMAQCDYSDSLSKKEKEKQLRVKYELDEFKNIGGIPFYDIKIATFRSRKIVSTMILQNISQLMTMFPNGAHETILTNTTTKILLKAGDLETAQYFSDMCGTTTIVMNNGRYSKGRSKVLDLHDYETVTDGKGQRPLLLPDKAMKLNANIVVICILGFQPIKLNKYIAEHENPMYMEETEEAQPKKHKPKWRKEQEEKQKEADAFVNGLSQTSGENVTDPITQNPTQKAKPPAAVPNSSQASNRTVKAKTGADKPKKRPVTGTSTSAVTKHPAPPATTTPQNSQKPVRAGQMNLVKEGEESVSENNAVTEPEETVQAHIPDTHDIKAESEPLEESSWICPVCGEENYDSVPVCINCETKRPGKKKNGKDTPPKPNRLAMDAAASKKKGAGLFDD